MFTPIVEVSTLPESTIIWQGRPCLTLAGAKRVATRMAKEYSTQFEREGHDCPVYPAIFGVTIAEKFGRIATRLGGEWLWSFPGKLLYAEGRI